MLQPLDSTKEPGVVFKFGKPKAKSDEEGKDYALISCKFSFICVI